MGKSLSAVVVVSFLLLPGCSGGTACPAIGWLNNLRVELDGEARSVAVVQGCVEDVCSEFVQVRIATDAPIETVTPDAGAGSSSGTSTPRQISPYSASRVDGDSWTVQFGMTTPDNVTVRALDADGAVLAEEDFAVDWVRVGGSERCGGPGEAGPVTLSVP